MYPEKIDTHTLRLMYEDMPNGAVSEREGLETTHVDSRQDSTVVHMATWTNTSQALKHQRSVVPGRYLRRDLRLTSLIAKLCVL